MIVATLFDSPELLDKALKQLENSKKQKLFK